MTDYPQAVCRKCGKKWAILLITDAGESLCRKCRELKTDEEQLKEWNDLIAIAEGIGSDSIYAYEAERKWLLGRMARLPCVGCGECVVTYQDPDGFGMYCDPCMDIMDAERNEQEKI